MAHKIIKLTEDNIKSAVSHAKAILTENHSNDHLGPVIALPTDTIYGLAGSAQDDKAIQRLYDIKGRSSSKPLAICLSEVAHIPHWAQTQNIPSNLLESLFPGPITTVLPRSKNLNLNLNPGVSSVGIRIPSYPFISQLIHELGGEPLALTSANKSSEPSCLSTEEFSSLWAELDAIYDGSQLLNNDQLKDCLEMDKQKIGSTVVDLTYPGHYLILREGCALSRYTRILEDFGLTAKDP